MFGGITGFFEKLSLCRLNERLVGAARLIANDARRQLNRSGVDRYSILLDEQKLLFIGHGNDDRRARRAYAVHVFPATFSHNRQEFPCVKRTFWVGFRFHFSLP